MIKNLLQKIKPIPWNDQTAKMSVRIANYVLAFAILAGFWVAGQAVRQPDKEAFASIMNIARLPIWITMGSNNNSSCSSGCDGCSSWSSECFNEAMQEIADTQSDLSDLTVEEVLSILTNTMSSMQLNDTGSGFSANDMNQIMNSLKPKLTPFKSKFNEAFDDVESSQQPPNSSKNTSYIPLASNLYANVNVSNEYVTWHVGGSLSVRWSNLRNDFKSGNITENYNNWQTSGSITWNPGGGNFFVGVSGDFSFDSPTGEFGGNVNVGAGFKF